MTSTRAMERKEQHSGQATRSISPRPVSDLAPQLITHVETTPAPLSDEGALSAIHTGLAEKELLPDQHLVDAGYVTAPNLVKTQSCYGVDLVGPTRKHALVPGGDWLRPDALLYRLAGRDGD